LFQQLIMQKAAEELKKQQEREMEEKKKAIESRVPKLEIDGLDKRTLMIISIIVMHNNVFSLCDYDGSTTTTVVNDNNNNDSDFLVYRIGLLHAVRSAIGMIITFVCLSVCLSV